MTRRPVFRYITALLVLGACAAGYTMADVIGTFATKVGKADARVTSLSQHGITWTFDKAARTGKYVTGDWWVVGPVSITAITPAPTPGRNGSVVNPPAADRLGYDDRFDPARSKAYDASLRVTLPLTLKPGESLVSTVSVDKVGPDHKTPDTVRGQYCRGPIRTAAVLTCVAEAPPKDAFRPAYVGTWKESFHAGTLRRNLLPKLKPAGKVPDVATYERYLERIWLDHFPGWRNRAMHPWENMPDYGREITNITSTVALMLTLEDPERTRETLLLRFVQLGIDYYGVVQSNNKLWGADGGHCSGRKIPILFAGRLLAHDGMMSVKASFAEDEQTYYGEGYRGQKVLWRITNGDSRKHEHLPPEKWAGPPFKGDNDGWKSEGYRSLNGPTWIGQALAARVMGIKAKWNHDAYFDYVDRWIREAPDGMVDKATRKPKGYNAFNSNFIKAMWDTYRDKADAIGAEMTRKTDEAPGQK